MKILIIGGNRFFGKKLAHKLVDFEHDVTLLNRGTITDGLGPKIHRIQCDRQNKTDLKKLVGSQHWDVIYDQVCFEAQEAQDAIDIFKGNVNHYIFTSSMSVYPIGPDLREEDFDPRKHNFSQSADRVKNYAEAKRQCEAVFFKNYELPVTAVRFPLVLGADDYTQRFSFHIHQIQNGEPIYFPNQEARISMISSDDAARALEFLLNKKPIGPLNVASPEPIRLIDFIRGIESQLGKKMKEAQAPNEKNHSPYGIEQNWYLNTTKLKSLGCNLEPITNWLPREIQIYLKQGAL